MGTMSGSLSRRDFMRTAAATGATLTVLGATARGQGKIFKIGLVGCGGRGMGAVATTIAAGQSLQVEVKMAAAADYFKEPVELAAQRYEIAKDRCFVGPDAYKKLCESDVDLVLLGAPPVFRPPHLEAAVKAGKHIFMEKPVAVDPVGCRRISAAGEEAKKKGLAIVAGTQRRHARAYRQVHYLVSHGAIGKITGGCVWWCQGSPAIRTREPGESDTQYLVRNWGSFVEMAGDHIVEQHVHNIDVANWFIGALPVAAVGVGARHRRQTGNHYDFFSVDFEYPDGVHIHSLCRQINGCWNLVQEYFVGTEGKTRGHGGTRPTTPKDIKPPDFPEHRGGPYVQEHVDLLDSILKSQPLNEARDVAESTLCGVMGRLSAYSGQRVEWKELTDPNANSPLYALQLSPGPEDFEKGEVKLPQENVVPLEGKE